MQNMRLVHTNPLLPQLKCLGETKNSERKEGSSCNRCRTNGIKCVFPQPATTKGSKRRRSTRTSRPPKSSSSKSSSPATMISTAPSPQLQTGVIHEATRDDLAHSMTGNTKPLFERTAGHFTGLGSGENVKQMNMTRTQSAGSEDQYSYLQDNGTVPIHHFDFNLSMLSTTDDSHGFDFLSDSFNEWPLEYDLSGGHVYSKLQARPFADDQRMHILIPTPRELQRRRFPAGFSFDIFWRILLFDADGKLGCGFAN